MYILRALLYGRYYQTRYMHDVRIIPSMGKAETTANGWISNRPSVVHHFYRVSSTSDILLVEIDQPSAFARDHLL